ncbi:MAG: xylulokinase [Chthoniobacterales bacterium]|nr:xylulokinase [Chthoniobacterales bacterium]
MLVIALGIDCGTQSLKTIALDGVSGEVLASSGEAYGMLEGLPSGHMEQDPGVWWNALQKTVGEVLSALGPRRSEVGAIGVSGQQHGFVPLDEDARVIRPAKLWCDTSTVAQCDEIRAAFGGRDALIALAGNDMLPGFTAPKILWLKQNEPANFAKLRHVALPHDFLNLRLTGKLRMEYGDASGTALFDVRRRVWSEPVCAAIDEGLHAKLPVVGSSCERCGVLRGDLGREWGLGEVIVSAGGGDNMMAAIGTGNVRPGEVTASLGTSGTIFACADGSVVDPRGEIAAFCDSNDRWLPLLCTMNVTVATELFRKMFGWDHARMEREIASVAPGADGLIFLPYLQGERTPDLPHGCGVLHGMNTSNTTPAHVARAVMEGVTLGMAYGLRRMEQLGVRPQVIRLTGGGSNSATWRQICADVFGFPVVTLRSAEGAALGAAIQSLAVAEGGSIEDLAARLAPVDEASRVTPREAFDYAARLQEQNRLRERLFDS